MPVEDACEGDGAGANLRAKEVISKGKNSAQVTHSVKASGPVPTNQGTVTVDIIQKVVKTGTTSKVGNDDPNEGAVPKQQKDKGKGIMVVVQEQQVVQFDQAESIPKTVGRIKRDELPNCTVNTVASLQSSPLRTE
ncbi:hypothetical protein OIU76_006456 [Salix suchowensis]|uniref:Uncharacterized protein n=1 Tax=Salix suchowensis TaxID=1278906 RepID=A0ABQ9BZ75_9ROSI|nr:hypothetical protein OIU76_006456 [Salix suchowensis]KAJ6392515.1 hypothetical protein OIU77_026299 [Salix suchowensis]